MSEFRILSIKIDDGDGISETAARTSKESKRCAFFDVMPEVSRKEIINYIVPDYESLREQLKRERGCVDAWMSYAIFISKCYQTNYQEFADYNPEIPFSEMSEDEKERYHDVALRFSTVQGFSLRRFVKEFSMETPPIESIKLADIERARETQKMRGKDE